MDDTAREPVDQGLLYLAKLYGIQPYYWDVTGVKRHASEDSLRAVLTVLGAPVGERDDIPQLIRERSQKKWLRPIEPVCVVWEGEPATVRLRLREGDASGVVHVRIVLEDGGEWSDDIRMDTLSLVDVVSAEGVTIQVWDLPLPSTVPLGYHTLEIEVAGGSHQSLLIAAPLRAYDPSGGVDREWGGFLPLYALRTARSFGAGDFTDLRALTEWMGGNSGGVVGTLPLLASFLTDPFEPSPFAPASRLFWNEFYLDVADVPELERCEDAKSLLSSRDLQSEIADLRDRREVDYRQIMALKRRVLEMLSATIHAESSGRRDALERFAAERTELDDYAAFRAVGERHQTGWPVWPEEARDGRITPSDYDESAMQYHRYVQWLADDQIGRVAEEANRHGPGLYVDLPIGVHPDSFDVWRERALYTGGVSVGSPPDPLAPQGQDWGFPAMKPDAMREDHYRHFIHVLRHHMRSAGVLRIDHVMGLHRLFWIPHGMPGANGVYVTYPAEEIYAVYCLESHRNRCMILGEDLGTVPDEVRPAMKRHNFHRTYVAQAECRPDPAKALGDAPSGSVASINTHDMSTFSAFWNGTDIDIWVRLGLLPADRVTAEQANRGELRKAIIDFLTTQGYLSQSDDPGTVEPGAVYQALVSRVAGGAARIVLLNLEDLWLEPEPQNVPGTSDDVQPNWRRKARLTLEEFRDRQDVLELLEAVRTHRGRRSDS